MESRIEKFTGVFFWVGYIVFLSASIPHVAAYFRHFDPTTTNRFEDISYWVIAVAIAVVIDVSDVLVSIAVIRAKANGATLKDTFLFWIFIFLIMGLSWFFNWQYNVVYGTSEFHVVDQYSIASGITIGQVNPVIGSAFQLLILVYTLMAHKFAQKPKEKTLEELMQEANEMEQKADYLARIDAVKHAASSRKWQARFDGIRQVKDEALKTIKGPDEVTPQGDPPALETRDIPVDLEQDDDEVDTDETPVVEPEFEDESKQDGSADLPQLEPISGKQSVSIEEATLILGLSESYVRELLRKGKLRKDARNKKKILLSSINSYQGSRQFVRKNGQTNGHQKITQPLDNFVELRV